MGINLSPLYPVKKIDSDGKHFYEIGNDETWRPGVTTILDIIAKPQLVPWAAKMASENIQEKLLELKELPDKSEIKRICLEGKSIYKKKSQGAADIGSRVHNAINQIIHGESPELTEDIKHGVKGFLDWKESNSVQIHLGDTKIGSKIFGFGGSFDMIGEDKEGFTLFDFKTTNKRKDRPHGIYEGAALQLAAYRQGFMETYGVKVKNLYGLWLNKEKPEFKAVKIANPDLCFEGFLAALNLYKNSKIEKFEEQYEA